MDFPLRSVFSLATVSFMIIAGTGFTPSLPLAVRTNTFSNQKFAVKSRCRRASGTFLSMGGDSPIFYDDFNDQEDVFDEKEDDDEFDDSDEELDPFKPMARSEFAESDEERKAEKRDLPALGTSNYKWGGELELLKQRSREIEEGRSTPSRSLFRLMTQESPNEAVSRFVAEAEPQTVQAMSGAISALLGGLSNPTMGVEIIVKASGERIATLCFQLQMTGYMFRNAEYVLALKKLLNIRRSATLDEYKKAFEKIDADGSGYIEAQDVQTLFESVYGEEGPPSYEVKAFLEFFDKNKDGRISWEEFERGLGDMTKRQTARAVRSQLDTSSNHDDEDDEVVASLEHTLSGKIELELNNGKVIEVEANDYINDLKKEAEALKEALRRESGLGAVNKNVPGVMNNGAADADDPSFGGVAGYIQSLKGDLQSLTQGVKPEVVEAMNLLIEFVLDGPAGKNGKRKETKREKMKKELELPGSALKQLALWQMVLGYRLREAEATGDYLKLHSR